MVLSLRASLLNTWGEVPSVEKTAAQQAVFNAAAQRAQSAGINFIVHMFHEC